MKHPPIRRVAALAAFAVAAGLAGPAAAEPQCPQPRFTGKAPEEYLKMPNPVPDSPEAQAVGEAVFQGDGRKISCASCHGKEGDGKGPLSDQFDPPPRDFTCADTIRGMPDGHLFWIIRFGSPGTSMPKHRKLKDDQIWSTVHYLRHLAK